MGEISDEAHADCLEILGECGECDQCDATDATEGLVEHPARLPSSSTYLGHLRQASEARIAEVLQRVKCEARAEAEAEAMNPRSRSRSKSPISRMLSTHADLKWIDFHQPCRWRAQWDSAYEAHVSLVRHWAPPVFEWVEETCWDRRRIGAWQECLRHVQMQVESIKSGAIQGFYVGLSVAPLCRYLGNSVFHDYGLVGHIDNGWDHCRVLAVGDAALIRALEMAVVALNPDSANRSKGGERAGAAGELSFLYLLWRVDVLV